MAEPRFAPALFNSYLSAFLSACRTITLALQQFKHIPRFSEWYEPHRDRLKSDPLARFFLKTRNLHVHGGPAVAPLPSFKIAMLAISSESPRIVTSLRRMCSQS